MFGDFLRFRISIMLTDAITTPIIIATMIMVKVLLDALPVITLSARFIVSVNGWPS